MSFECQERNANYRVICTLVSKVNLGHNALSFRVTSTGDSLEKWNRVCEGKQTGPVLENNWSLP